jgi:predicted dehydrogenase
MNTHGMNRRAFVKGAAAMAAGVTILPRHVLGGPGFIAPSDTVNVAAVGAGGMGASNMNALHSQNIVAIADVDFEHVAQSFVGRDGSTRDNRRELKEAYDKAARFTDWRRMLDEVPDIDAVVVATPDHNHAIVANTAMTMGKHVYVQKPLTWSVAEARTLQKTAGETGVVTQMGNQGHSGDEGRRVIDLVRGGAIGPVHEVHVWTNRPLGYWPQAIPRPTETVAAPAEINWDVWIGPAPYVEYHPAYHPFAWRGWVDYGVGALGDMGAHLIDHAYWALELGYPTKIWGTSTPFGGVDDEQASWPAGNVVYYEYAGEGREPVHLTWYDGGLLPGRPAMLPDDVELNRGGGAILVGDIGILIYDTYGNNPRIYPEEVAETSRSIAEAVPRVEAPSHEMNWINAILGTEEVSSPFSYAAPLTENMLLGTAAVRAGKVLQYDADNMRFPNAPDAERYLGRDYREGWKL